MHHRLMRIMVWNMRWMTRHAGFIARPLVRLYGANEIIACGLRDEEGNVSIIFTPGAGHGGHHVVSLADGSWKNHVSTPMKNFSGAVVRRYDVPNVKNGVILRMRGQKENGSQLSSPKITVKPQTIYNLELLSIRPNDDKSVMFSWKQAEGYDPMIYFLAVENNLTGDTLSAIYTRETFWRYPAIKTASYSVGPSCPPQLANSASYTAKLVLVDYDGWVSHVAEKQFQIR